MLLTFPLPSLVLLLVFPAQSHGQCSYTTLVTPTASLSLLYAVKIITEITLNKNITCHIKIQNDFINWFAKLIKTREAQGI
jgi:hypothetical protein